MLDQILTLQTLAGTVSGAAMTLVLSACAQRVPWPSIRSARDVSQKADRAASGPAPLAAGPPVSAAAPAPEQPETALPSSAPPRVLAHYQDGLTHKTRVAPVKAARILISFMQEHDATGYFTPAEINEWWRWACKELKLDQLHPDVVRAELAALPNVWKPNTRLNAPEYRAVKARTGKERSILYRIPAARLEAGGASGAEREGWEAIGKKTGQRPASGKRGGKSGDQAAFESMVSGSALYREAA